MFLSFYCLSLTPLNIKHGRQNNVSHCHYSLVIVGGDGTMNEIINGLLQRKQRDCGVDVNDKTAVLKTIDIPIAFIPAGKYIKYYKLCLLNVPCSCHNVFVVSVFFGLYNLERTL